MNWLREFWHDLRFMIRHTRRLIKALVRSRLGYKRIYKSVLNASKRPHKSSKPYRDPGLEHESRLLGRSAQYVGQTEAERNRREFNAD